MTVAERGRFSEAVHRTVCQLSPARVVTAADMVHPETASVFGGINTSGGWRCVSALRLYSVVLIAENGGWPDYAPNAGTLVFGPEAVYLPGKRLAMRCRFARALQALR